MPLKARITGLCFAGALALALSHGLRAGAQQPTIAAPIIATNKVPGTVHALKAPGIENFFQLSDRIYSGSAPEGDAAFAALKARGIKTIITVDGAKPDVETAKRFGMQYVHLPIGYDGVPTSQAVRMVKAAESLPGPIFVHCHHGLHRGPAGAAVICMAVEGWSPEEAGAWMHMAGTATNYMGLYKTVAAFRPPSAEALEALPAMFPEKSDISPLADAMIEIDGRFDNIKLIKKVGYRKPADHPDLDPAHEALLLDELFKELLRSPALDKRNADFRAKLTQVEQAADALHTALQAPTPDALKLDATVQRITDSCAACHKAFRN